MKKGAGGPALGMERFCQEMFELGVAKEASVTPVSPVKGVVIPAIKCSLSLIDCKGAFVSSQKVEKNNANDTINLDEFVTCLALCGTIKYAEAKGPEILFGINAVVSQYNSCNFVAERFVRNSKSSTQQTHIQSSRDDSMYLYLLSTKNICSFRNFLIWNYRHGLHSITHRGQGQQCWGSRLS